MKLHEMKPTEGSRKDRYRAARGMAQGRGKQAGKGQSGQNKRGGTRPGFEGGQNPIYRRIPKFGFTNFNQVNYQIISLDDLNMFAAGATVTETELRAKGMISRKLPIKLLNNGKLTKKLTVKIDAASGTAVKAVQKAGGKVEFN